MKKSIGSKKSVFCMCAVLLAVSAFFYAPMDVRANSIDLNGSTSAGYVYPATGSRFSLNTNSYDFGVVDSDFVEVDFDIDFSFIQSVTYAIFSPSVVLHCGDFAYSLESSEHWNSAAGITSYNQNYKVNFVCKSSDLCNVYVSMAGSCFGLGEKKQNNSISISANFNSYNFSPVASTDGDSYQNGYNAGFSAGEQVGYGNGYSQGYLEGEESGFQAGQESVDTQSYYDAGYNAGYSSGYQIAYSSGYNAGLEAGRNVNGSISDSVSVSGDGYSETLVGSDFYVSSSGIVDVEANGQASYNTILGTYHGTTTFSAKPSILDLNAWSTVRNVDGSIQSFAFNITPYLDINTGTSNPDVQVITDYQIKSAYVIYEGQKYYGTIQGANYGSPVVFFEFYHDEKDKMMSINNFSHNFYFEVDYSAMAVTDTRDTIYFGAFCTPKMTISQYWSNLYSYKVVYNDDLTGSVIDDQTDEITGALEEQKEVQQSQLEEQKEQTETQKGIWQSIKDFFGSFFDNLINSIIHVVVPTKEEMSELFNRLNDFFAETFGFLYYPFDFIIDAFNIFLEADSETGLTLPGFSIMGYEVWGNQTYDIASEPIVGTIFGYVRMGTGAMLAMWFVNYLRNFFDKRFGGGGN